MKSVISGKLYNTDTAKRLGVAESSLPVNDFNYWCEELYLKKSGEYFLYGEGGAMSHWSKPYGNNGSQWGCGIKPITEESAKLWAESKLSADEYISIFGEPSE